MYGSPTSPGAGFPIIMGGGPSFPPLVGAGSPQSEEVYFGDPDLLHGSERLLMWHGFLLGQEKYIMAMAIMAPTASILQMLILQISM